MKTNIKKKAVIKTIVIKKIFGNTRKNHQLFTVFHDAETIYNWEQPFNLYFLRKSSAKNNMYRIQTYINIKW